MKTLLLMRHASAVGYSIAARDFDRELTALGLTEAAGTASYFKSEGEIPEMILSSAARRAAQTAEIIARQLGLLSHLVHDAGLYAAGVEKYVRHIKGLSKDVSIALVVGHNPTISMLTQWLDNSGDSRRYFSEAGAACLKFQQDEWNAITHQSAEVKWYRTPS